MGIFALAVAIGVQAGASARPAKEPLTVVVDKALPPYSMLDSQGHLIGLRVDMWKRWSQVTGIPVTIIPADWAEAEEMVRSGSAIAFDAILEAPERYDRYSFAKKGEPLAYQLFYRSSLVGVTDIKTSHPFTVGVESADYCGMLLRGKGQTNIKEYRTYADVVSAAVASKLHVFCMDRHSAIYYLTKFGKLADFKQSPSIFESQTKVAVLHRNAAWLPIIENGFNQLSSEEVAALRAKWFGAELAASVIPVRLPAWLYGFLVFAVAFCVVKTFQVFKLRRQMVTAERAAEAAEAAAAQDRVRLTATLAAFPDLFLELDTYGQCIAATVARHLLQDFSAQELEGKHFSAVLLEPIAVAIANGVRDARVGSPAICQLNLGNGDRIEWYELTVAKHDVTAAGGASHRILGRDITSQAKLVADLAEARRACNLMEGIADSITQAAAPSRLLQKACHALADIGGYAGVAVYQLTASASPTLQRIASEGVAFTDVDRYHSLRVSGTSLFMAALSHAQTATTALTMALWQEEQPFDVHDPIPTVCIFVPIRVAGQPFGLLELYADSTPLLNDAEISLLVALASLLGAALTANPMLSVAEAPADDVSTH